MCLLRFIPVVALALFACAPTPEPNPEPTPESRGGRPSARVLLIGWDGASFERIDPLLAAGKLPNLARLLERGSSAELASTVVPISSAAWPTLATGKGPGHTGVYGFFDPIPGSYEERLTSARSIRATPLWRMLTRRGLGAHVIGVPLTFPPEPLIGTMVSGMLSPFDATYTFPPELTRELRSRGFEPDLERWHNDVEPSWERLDTQLALKRGLLLETLAGTAGDGWSLAFVVFKSLDVVSHRALGAEFEAYVDPVYERLDRLLGDLVEAVGEDTDVVLVSDHGFRVFERGFNLHAWLIEAGFATARGEAPPASVPDTTYAAVQRLEREARLADLDLERSRALASVCEGNFGGIRVNLAGREPDGAVGDLDAELTALEAALGELKGLDGEPLVRRTWRSSELYPGPHQDLLPDLLFELDPRYQAFVRAERQVLGEYTEPIPDHAREGVFFASGPSFARVAERGRLELVDVLPLVLHVLDLPLYAELEGTLARELLTVEHEPRVVPEAEDPTRDLFPDPWESATESFSEDEVQALRERLRALGYGD